MKEETSNARKTLESSVIRALWKTSPETHLTIDKCNSLVPRVVDELFHPSVRWAVEQYLEEVNKK